MSCAHPHARVTFANDSATPVTAFWLDYGGERLCPCVSRDRASGSNMTHMPGWALAGRVLGKREGACRLSTRVPRYRACII